MKSARRIKDTPYLNTVKNRFYSYVKLPNENGCMEWSGNFFGNGYGMININRKGVLAHRFSFMLHFHKIDRKTFVLHKCDNTRCVNPDHLFLGTQKDNMIDMSNKNRAYMKKGEMHPNCKLSNDDLAKIKEMTISGVSQLKISKLFKVSQTEISHVLTGKSRNFITDIDIKEISNIVKEKKILVGRSKRKLNNESVMEIRKLLSLGFTCTDISKKYLVHRSVINRIKLNKTYQEI